MLIPVFHTTQQRGLDATSDWTVFDYVRKENPRHHGIKALVAFDLLAMAMIMLLKLVN